MKIQIEQPKLHALLSRVQNAVERKNVIPILGHVLLNASSNTLTATGTDLDVEVRTTAEATVDQPGGCTVNISMLMPIVTKLQKGKQVTLESDGVTLSIKSGSANLKLNCLPIEDFPSLASPEYESQFQAGQSDLARLFNLTAFAVSTDETRYFLKGVYLHTHDGAIRGVSTDGHRLACADSTIQAAIPGVIVPTKTVGLIKSLLGDEGDATVRVSEAKVQIDIGHSVVTSKVVDGTYPDYSRVIPQQHNSEVIVDAGAVKQAAALVSLVSGEKVRAVKIKASDEELTLTVQSGAEVGVESVEAELIGDPIECGVNAKYLADVLGVCEGDKASIRFQRSGDPILIKPVDDDGVLFVMMPMRV